MVRPAIVGERTPDLEPVGPATGQVSPPSSDRHPVDGGVPQRADELDGTLAATLMN